MDKANRIKSGTKVLVLAPCGNHEEAVIGRWHSSYTGIDKPAGYHPVTFKDGGKILAHETMLRVL